MRTLCLNPNTVKKGLFTKDYKIMPNDVLGIDDSLELFLKISTETLEEFVLNLSLDIEQSPFSKRIKFSTPVTEKYIGIKDNDVVTWFHGLFWKK